jgi:hypothetical protein
MAAAEQELDRLLRGWRDDIDSVPFPTFTCADLAGRGHRDRVRATVLRPNLRHRGDTGLVDAAN